MSPMPSFDHTLIKIPKTQVEEIIELLDQLVQISREESYPELEAQAAILNHSLKNRIGLNLPPVNAAMFGAGFKPKEDTPLNDHATSKPSSTPGDSQQNR